MNSRASQPSICNMLLKRYGVIAALCVLAGCTSGPQAPGINIVQRPPNADGAPSNIPPNLAAIPDAVPRYEPRTHAGNPDSYDVFGKRYVVLKDSRNYVTRGVASWYGDKFHGLKTSNGENYDMFAMTAAHKTLPIPCYARITNLQNGRAVTVRINDRGPFVDGRIIDLSYTAAYKLGILDKGTGYVEVRTVEPGRPLPPVYTAAAEMPVGDHYSGEKMFVQVGAFSDPANARKLQAQLSARQSVQALVRPIAHQSGWLYHVQLGPVASLDQANQLASRLGEMGITETRFIVERSN